MQPALYVLLGLLTFINIGVTLANTLDVNDPFPQVTLTDAADNTFQLPYTGIRYVLFSSDMKGNDLVKEAYADLDKDQLREAGIAYIADISKMPRLISRLFALPKIRDYPFRVLLIREKDFLTELPRQPETVTVLTLTADAIIEAVTYTESAETLQKLIK